MSKAITANVLRNYEHSYRISIAWAVLWGLIALMVQTHTLINLDNAWLLYAAGRMVNGETPYVDFFETNPPLILWIDYIPAFIAHALSVNAIPVFMLFVIALALFSLWLALHELKNNALLSEPRYGNIVFAVLAQLLLGSSVLLFGQREHLFILLALPYFVQSSCLEGEPAFSFRQALIAVMAGLGFAIKPYFIAIWAAGELFGAIKQRKLGLLFRRTNWIIGGTGLLYCACVYLFTPHYFNSILPMMMLTYGGFMAGNFGIFMQVLFISLMYFVPAFLIRLDAQQRAFAGKLACWFAAAVFTAVAQHKGWLNHFFPAIFFGTFFLAGLLAIAFRQWQTGVFQLDRKHFALLWSLGFITLGLPIYHLVSTRSTENYQQDYINKLNTFIADTNSGGKPFYAISFNLGTAFPAVNYLPVTFPFHFHHLWTLPGIISAEKAGDLPEPMAQARNFTIHTVAEDLSAFQPALVVIDDNQALPEPFKNFDFISYFRQDALFRKQWNQYRKIGQIAVDGKSSGEDDGHYTVYSRITGEHL